MEEFSKEELERERWKDIDGYDGMYQVSDLGRVRSLKCGKTIVMRPGKCGNGYLTVQLWRNGQGKTIYVHRIVAQAFIENTDETKTIINHRNEIKSDNRVSNIEWCTAQYNTNYNDVQFRKKNRKRRKIAKLYRPELSYKENYKIFKENGIECSKDTVQRLRKDISLKGRSNWKRNEIKELYNPDLSYQENIKLFRANNIECCKATLYKLRKELGLAKKYKK